MSPTFSAQSGICMWCPSWCGILTVLSGGATIPTEETSWSRSPEHPKRPETPGCAASKRCSAWLCRKLKELQFDRDKASGAPHLKGKYEHWRPQGAWQNEEQFSDGTLRLLGLLWATLEGSGLFHFAGPCFHSWACGLV